MRTACSLALLLLASISLVSCSTTPVTGPHEVTDSSHWQLSGKLSIRQDRDTRVASISWQQAGDQSEIMLSAALGLGRVIISGGPDVMIIDTGRETLELKSTDVLQVDGSSYRLPWQALRWWVRGQSVDGQPLPAVYQSGEWQILTHDRDELGPRLMEFQHPQLSLRLKIQRWQFGVEATDPVHANLI